MREAVEVPLNPVDPARGVTSELSANENTTGVGTSPPLVAEGSTP